MQIALRIAAAALVIVFAATAEAQQRRSPKEVELERKVEQPKEELRKAHEAVIAMMRAPLDKRLQEPALRSCTSPNLTDAVASPPLFLAQMRGGPVLDDTSFVLRIWTTMLDIADAVGEAGCPAVARKLYDEVIRVFVGLAYTALRQRAQIAIDDLRARR